MKEYINDGRCEIDCNNIENTIWPLTIGIKNYIFAGSHESAQNTAIFYSFFAIYKTNTNPHTWLFDVTNRIPEQIANKLLDLYPKNENPKIRIICSLPHDYAMAAFQQA